MNFASITLTEIALSTFAFISIIYLGLAVYLKNPKSWTNRFFFLLAIVLNVYIIFNALSLHPPKATAEDQLFWIRSVMLITPFIATFLFMLAHSFPKNEISLKKGYLVTIIISTIFNAGAALTPFVFSGLSYTQGSPVPISGIGIGIFMLHSVGLFIASIVVLFMKYKRAAGLDKVRILYLLIGILTSFSLIVVFTIILVLILKISLGVFLGPIFPVLLMLSIGYSIIKHKFLDIQPIIARAVSYSLLVVVLAGVYSFLIFYGVNKLLGVELNVTSSIISTVLAAIIALTFQPLHSLIRKLTDKLFFKGIYDADKILSDLTHALSSTIKFDDLAENLLRTIVKEMRVTEAAILLVAGESITATHSVGYKNISSIKYADLNNFLNSDKYKNKRYFTASEITEGKDLFTSNNIEALFPIRAKGDLVAILVMGTKASGLPYSTQDINILDVFASEASIALDNARLYTNLQLALESKSKFISVVSHQLRTPVSGIRWGLEKLKDDASDKATLETSYQKAIFLGEQLDDILIALDIYDKKIVASTELCNLDETIAGVIKTFESSIKNDGLKINIDIGADAGLVTADYGKLKKILTTFIKNAVLYSKEKGNIEIKSYKEKNNIIISVKDEGIGITDGEKNHIFEQFFRSDRAKIKLPDGLGLGMFVAKEFAKAQDGKIWFESDGAEKGSVFYISLPIK